MLQVCRVTEIISLNVEDVNLEEEYVVCKSATREKNYSSRKKCKKALEEYLNDARNAMIKVMMKSIVC